MAQTRHAKTLPVLGLLTPAWLCVLWLVSKAQWFWNNRPDLQFGWIVLLLAAFLVWDRWERRPALQIRFTPVTAFLALAGAAVLVFFQLFLAAFGLVSSALLLLSIGAFFIIAANFHYLFGNAGLRHFAFPFLFLLVALPIPSGIYNLLVSTLQSQIATLNVELLNLGGIPAQRVGSLIHLPNGTVGVNEACSGIRSLQSTVMATLFIGYLTLKRFSLQAILFASGIGFAFLGNLIRSLYLSLTANAKGIAAVEKVHDAAGWSILLFTASGVAAVAWMLAKAQRWAETQEHPSTHARNEIIATPVENAP